VWQLLQLWQQFGLEEEAQLSTRPSGSASLPELASLSVAALRSLNVSANRNCGLKKLFEL
jgi:hypothetical protein